MDFIPSVIPPMEPQANAIWLAFHKTRMMMFADHQGPMVPEAERFSRFGIPHETEHFLGTYLGKPVYAVELGATDAVPEPFYLQELRHLAMEVDPDFFQLAGRALQILQWDRDHKFCSRCGEKVHPHETERAKVCSGCGFTQYPRISPCIITLVTRDEYVLLGRAPQWPENMYSTLAGFVEPGETLEAALHREVFEEVSIRVHRLSYMGSQPWPFPHSLMVGFYAQYLEGEIQVDGVEIADAQWFHIDELPRVPPVGSISRQLIDGYRLIRPA